MYTDFDKKTSVRKVKLCYWGIATGKAGGNAGGNHIHDYYQAQFTISGSCKVFTDCGEYILNAGDLLFIAPNVVHRLEYLDDYRSHTYKFTCSGKLNESVIFVESNQFTGGVIAACQAIMDSTFPTRFFDLDSGAVVLPQDNYQISMEYYLAGVIAMLQSNSGGDNIIDRFRELLSADDRCLFSVTDAAKACGYSRNHFCTLIKKHTGQVAKVFINQLKIENARRYLRYSQKPLSEIARLIGFSSQFHFSDFFKRETGIPPSQYRKKFSKIN